ncbi:hypothetical protein X762_29115 [Mesorhizobium sp. LSHC426A00]|nr:hypothetical protein X762_29115 [Mesorhizobium sp. LSHC426A00]
MSAFCEASLIEIAPVVKSKALVDCGRSPSWKAVAGRPRPGSLGQYLGALGAGTTLAYALWNHRRLDAFAAGEMPPKA